MKSTIVQTEGGILSLPESLREVSTFVAKEQGRWFEDEFEFVTDQLCDSETVVIEIGAGFGFYTTKFSQTANQVEAFEPDPKIIPHLTETLRLNSTKNVNLHSSPHPARDTTIAVDEGSNLLVKINSPVSSVASLNIDHYIKKHTPVIIVTVCKEGQYDFGAPKELVQKYDYAIFLWTPSALVPFSLEQPAVTAAEVYLTQLIAIPKSKVSSYPSTCTKTPAPVHYDTSPDKDLRILTSILFNKKWAAGQQLLWVLQNQSCELYNKALAAYCEADQLDDGWEKSCMFHTAAEFIERIPESILQKNSCMLSTLARIYHSLRMRKQFVDVLEAAITVFDPEIVSETPFVPCLPSFDDQTAVPASTVVNLVESTLRLGYISRSRFSSVFCDQNLLNVFIENLKQIIQTGYLVLEASRRLCVLTEASNQIAKTLEAVRERQQALKLVCGGLLENYHWAERIEFPNDNGVTSGWYPNIALKAFGIPFSSVNDKRVLIFGSADGRSEVEAMKNGASQILSIQIDNGLENEQYRAVVDLCQFQVEDPPNFRRLTVNNDEWLSSNIKSYDVVICDLVLPSGLHKMSLFDVVCKISKTCIDTAYITLPVLQTPEELSDQQNVQFHEPTGTFRPTIAAAYSMFKRAGFLSINHAHVVYNVVTFTCQFKAPGG